LLYKDPTANCVQQAADVVVNEIVAAGGKAIANYDSVENGDKIIEAAVKAFGTVHVVINNAGILRDVSFKKMTDADWDLINNVHIYGAYKVTKAAWPYFRKQKFGRIINTSSAAGLYGNFGQTNYSAAKLALVGFTETLAKEGQKYNILANAIAPLAASRMTETIMPPEILERLNPEYIVPLVAYLTHQSSTETYGVYELGAGFYSKIRWERGSGHIFKADDSFTPSAILKEWNNVVNTRNPEYPNSPANFIEIAERSRNLPPNAQGEPVDLKDQVVIVTGAGAGIGRAYALLLGKLGAKVVVNDFVDPEPVVQEIRQAGGIAVGDKSNVIDGAHVVNTALKEFSAIHAIVNNAGILRDKSFQNLTDDQWKQVIAVHLKGTYAVTKAAWPHLQKQKYGRIINTTSTSGIYGNFGQSNYAAAKLGILGFSKALAVEGQKYNIYVNTIAPNAGTAMTKSIIPEELWKLFKPEQIAPFVALLASQKAPISGGLFEVGSGWIGATRWQRSGGVFFRDGPVTPEKIRDNWAKIVDFNDGRATYPVKFSDSTKAVLAEEEPKGPLDYVAKADYDLDFKKVILYNLSVGAKASELKHSFEGVDDFEVIPTFGVIPYFACELPLEKMVPNFNPKMLLHGEQYLEIRSWPLPTDGHLETTMKPLEIVDKGKAAVIIAEATTVDKKTGNELFYNVSSSFIRGSGGFGGKSKAQDRGAITAVNKPPARAPDFVETFKISDEQAAYYRLNGDFNPLHIDPAFAAVGNFPKPILHGLCSFGISGRLLYNKFGAFKNIKVRFTGHVFLGETLQVEAWKVSKSKIIFQTKVLDRNTVAISAAAIELMPSPHKL
jgi:multifunctional beta-oxidation protein